MLVPEGPILVISRPHISPSKLHKGPLKPHIQGRINVESVDTNMRLVGTNIGPVDDQYGAWQDQHWASR